MTVTIEFTLVSGASAKSSGDQHTSRAELTRKIRDWIDGDGGDSFTMNGDRNDLVVNRNFVQSVLLTDKI